MRVLFLGASTAFSLPAAQALLQSDHEVAGVVLPERISQLSHPSDNSTLLPVLPFCTNDTIINATRRQNVPLWFFEDVPKNITADVIIVACFPSRLPENFLRRATLAALNVHPSWLPEYRGPAPLFWQLRHGVRNPGVTVHHMTDRIDAGDIVVQKRVPLPEGSSGPEADRLLSVAGANMLLDVLSRADFRSRPQLGTASYQSWPAEEDWCVPTDWLVQRAFNFMRGTADWRHPFKLLTHPQPLVVQDVTDYALQPSQPGSVQLMRQGWRVGFADGWLMVR